MVQNITAYCHWNLKQSNTKRQVNGTKGWKPERERLNMNETSMSHSEGFQLFQNSMRNYIIKSRGAEQAGCVCEFHSTHIGINNVPKFSFKHYWIQVFLKVTISVIDITVPYNTNLSVTVYITISNIKMHRVSHTEQLRVLSKATVTPKQNIKLWRFLLPTFSN